jgi:3-deoxy-manno-octulosonate cytidylyltransferase (CMP-KDO synthetase)
MPKEYSILVPARMASTRLPNKLALRETGKPLLAHSLENLQGMRDQAELWLVTDSEDLAEIGKDLVDGVHMSTKEFGSGTERIAEALPKIQTEWILNVQADEPEIDVSQLIALMETVIGDPDIEMGTLGVPFHSRDMWGNPNAVKVICDSMHRALYFSRQPLPHGGGYETKGLYHHLGVYAYSKSLLRSWSKLPVGTFEACEKLEQLRALENGISIAVEPVSCAQKGIDTPEDYHSFVRRFS